MDNASPVERCNSAPLIAWDEPAPSSSVHSKKAPSSQQRQIEEQSAKLIKPQSVRLRRHSSLTRGLLHAVRKISESDERHGEAKASSWVTRGQLMIYLTQVNNSINLSSSTEKLNMSSNSTPPSPSLLSSPSNMFRPIKNSPSWEYQPSPEKDGYGLRPRNSTGKQCTRPSSRKR